MISGHQHPPRAQAVAVRQLDNARVIVSEWRFAPGAETGWHRHGYDYGVVPLVSGRLLLETAAGAVFAELEQGRSYAREGC